MKSENHGQRLRRRLHEIRTALTITFPDPKQEAQFKMHYQQPLLRMSQWAMIAGGVMAVIIFLQTYRAESRSADKPFGWALDDPRTSFFAILGFIALDAFLGLLYILLKPMRKKIPCLFQDEEFCILSLYFLVTVAISCADRWHLARAYGMDPARVWISDTKGASGSHILAVDATLTLVSLFVPLRVSRTWIVHVSCLSIYFAKTISFGTPFPDQEVNRSGFLIMLVFFAHFGAWRNERQARRLWQSLQGKQAQVVSERVLRFDAERQLDQVTGNWWQTASGNPVVDHQLGPQLLESTNSSVVSQSQPSWTQDPECAKPKCFIPTGTRLICRNEDSANCFKVCNAQDIGNHAILLALDRISGEVVWVEARGEEMACPDHGLNWSELTFEGTEGSEEASVVVANAILTRTDSKGGSQRTLWRAPGRLSLGSDMLHGAHVCSSSSGGGAVFDIKPQLLCLLGKQISAAPSSIVCVELANPESHSLLFLGSASASRLAIAVSCFAGIRVLFSDKDDLTTPETGVVSMDETATYSTL